MRTKNVAGSAAQVTCVVQGTNQDAKGDRRRSGHQRCNITECSREFDASMHAPKPLGSLSPDLIAFPHARRARRAAACAGAYLRACCVELHDRQSSKQLMIDELAGLNILKVYSRESRGAHRMRRESSASVQPPLIRATGCRRLVAGRPVGRRGPSSLSLSSISKAATATKRG